MNITLSCQTTGLLCICDYQTPVSKLQLKTFMPRVFVVLTTSLRIISSEWMPVNLLFEAWNIPHVFPYHNSQFLKWEESAMDHATINKSSYSHPYFIINGDEY